MIERRYWDSDCFLGWLQEEPDKVDKCAAVLAFADRGESRIVTSTLTLTEVLMLRGREALLRTRRPDVTALFNRKSIVTMALTRRIAEEARELVWEHGVKPKDAIHVASALASGAAVLNTFDRDLAARSGALGEPPLTTEPPEMREPELALDHGQDAEPDPA